MQVFRRLQRKTGVLITFCLICAVLFSLQPYRQKSTTLLRLVEIEGVEPVKPSSSLDQNSSPFTTDSQVIVALKQRFRYRQYPFCDNNLERFTKLLRPSVLEGRLKKESISIAITLHNSAEIIPALGVALVETLQYLLPWYRIYLSVYENGSTDHTKPLLAELTTAFDQLGIDGLFIRCTHTKSEFEERDRIMLLSEIRNLALSPLLPYAQHGAIIFLNDVVTCASDILELLYQKNLQKADAIVGLDWIDDEAYPTPYSTLEEKAGNASKQLNISHTVEYQPRLYDLWVARGINGEMPYIFGTNNDFDPRTPSQDWIADLWSTQSNEIHKRWLSGLPFPVYSGWGGMVVIDARLFTQQHLRFRSSISSGWNSSIIDKVGAWNTLVSDDHYLLQDCPGASECEYVFRDIWNLRNGRARIAVAPRARAAYSLDDWMNMATFIPPERCWLRDVSDPHMSVFSKPQSERIDWDLVAIPTSVVCVAGRNRTGHAVDVWTEPRYYLDPRYQVVLKNPK